MSHPSPLLLPLACLVGIAADCTAAQGRAVEAVVAHVGCALVAVFDPQDAPIGTLCQDIAAAVEAEVAASPAPVVAPTALLAHRHRRKRVRLVETQPARDPGETIDEAYLPAVARVLARQAKP